MNRPFHNFYCDYTTKNLFISVRVRCHDGPERVAAEQIVDARHVPVPEGTVASSSLATSARCYQSNPIGDHRLAVCNGDARTASAYRFSPVVR